MERIESISLLQFILTVINAENPISFALRKLSCKIPNWIFILQDLYLCFSSLLQSYSHLLISKCESCWSSFLGKNKNVDTAVSSTSKPCINENGKNETLIRGDIEIVMEKLGISWDSNENELQEMLGVGEISTLFDEIEPSLEEVKEAFDLFDDNKDGYIDAKDLEKILCALGHGEISESECQRIILAFSSNGDKRIDFRRFVKVIEDSFC